MMHAQPRVFEDGDEAMSDTVSGSDSVPTPQARPDFDAKESDLRELLENAAPAFLLGAGCSKVANLPLIGELTDLVLEDEQLTDKSRLILTSTRDEFAKDSDDNHGHIEDFLSELVDVLAIAERRAQREAGSSTIMIGAESYEASDVRDAIESIKESIVRRVNKPQPLEVIGSHRALVRSVHRPVRQGRRNPGLPVPYLVLNYDTLLEDALGVERISFSDGMDGGATAWWAPDEFRRQDVQAKVLKASWFRRLA